MAFRKALLAASALALPLGALTFLSRDAAAQPVVGLYIGAGAGVNWLQSTNQSQDITVGAVRLGGDFKATFEPGFAGVASLGWGFGNGLRAEIEGNFRWNAVDELNMANSRLLRTGGYVRSYGVMANLLYDFDPRYLGLAGRTWIQPYIGAGVGYVWHEYDNVRGRFPAGSALAGATGRIDDTDARFAYQAIIGAAFPFTDFGVPGLTLTAEYRFLGTLEPELQASISSPAGATTNVAKIEPQNFNHAALVGLRYAFNQPRPAPAVVPPVAAPAEVARTYLVFFDWDRADLTDRARAIIGDAAQNSRRVQTTRIEVAGHADRSGSPQYNQRLSQRRADNVAAELVRNGVGRNEIIVSAFGESRPLVPTADGVREPQNRRVEIVLR